MTRDPFNGLVGSHASRSGGGYLLDQSPVRRGSYPTGNEYMFLEDVRQHSLPYRLNSEDAFEVQIISGNDEAPEIVGNSLPGRGYGGGSLEGSLRDYLSSALHHLLNGILVLEIEYFSRPEVLASKPVAFSIRILDPDFLKKRFGKYRLLVPSGLDLDKTLGWRWEKLKGETLTAVTLPRRQKRDVKRALNAIRAMDQDVQVMTDFTVGRHGAKSGFDFAAYQRRSRDIVLRASAPVGWSGRGLFTEGLLDPEKAQRAIQFERFVASLRDVALSGLQATINKAGGVLGFDARIELNGVLDARALDRMQEELAKGTRPISELLHSRHPGTKQPEE